MATEQDRPLEIFTIYVNPKDYPGKFVVRRWSIVRGNPKPVPDAQPWAVTDSLAAARAALPPALYRLERQPGDQPQILETWF